MTTAPAQSQLLISITAIHEIGHAAFSYVHDWFGWASLQPGEDMGGVCFCHSSDAWRSLVLHMAGIAAVRMISPFTRTISHVAQQPIVQPLPAGQETGREIIHRLDSVFASMDLPPMSPGSGPSDTEKFEIEVETLATSGRIKRRRNYQQRWRTRAISRAVRFMDKHRFDIRALAVELEIRRAISESEVTQLLAERKSPLIGLRKSLESAPRGAGDGLTEPSPAAAVGGSL